MTNSGDPLAIAMFVLVILVTLAITAWAARKTKTANEFYAAGSRISGAQNGIAIAGDFMSAATFLGITGLIFAHGYDIIIYILSPVVGLGIVLAFMADKIRNLGRYTFADVLSFRLKEKPVRITAAISSLAISLLYLMAQIVGAGALIQILFGLPYEIAVVIVGALMILYVSLGGMIATTWVQITKAAMLSLGIALIAILILAEAEFDLGVLYANSAALHANGRGLFEPGLHFHDPLASVSLAIGLVMGMAGLPHILMRFFTVPDAKQARRSVFFAVLIIGFVLSLIFFIVGFGAVSFLVGNPDFTGEGGGIMGGTNMVALHLSRYLGGPVLLGIMSAVAFATILAVVAGLTLASAAAISHDLYANVFRKDKTGEGREVLVSRIATIGVGITAILLGLAFEGQNIAYMAALAFTVAASANFPVLILALYWPGLTTRGAVWGTIAGLVIAIVMVILGPAVWVGALGNPAPLVPFEYPALFSIIPAFLTIWIVSITDPEHKSEASKKRFQEQLILSELGSGGI